MVPSIRSVLSIAVGIVFVLLGAGVRQGWSNVDEGPAAVLPTASAEPTPTTTTTTPIRAAPSDRDVNSGAPAASAAPSNPAATNAGAAGGASMVTFLFNAGTHPSCAAEMILRKRQFAGQGAESIGSAMVADTEPLTLFAKHDHWNCWKHGGHYKPGYPRDLQLPPLPPLAARELGPAHKWTSSDGLEIALGRPLYDAAASFYRGKKDGKMPPPSRVVLQRVVVAGGRLYWCHPAQTRRGGTNGDDTDELFSATANASSVATKPVTFPIAGAFSMVTGNWPQSVAAETPPLHPMPPKWAEVVCGANSDPSQIADVAKAAGLDYRALGYYQFPTDFLSAYHVFIEVVYNAFVALWRHPKVRRAGGPQPPNNGGGGGQPPALIVTDRPTYSRYGFKANSCKHGAGKCLGSLWARLMRRVAEGAAALGAGASPAVEPLKSAELSADSPGSDWIVGLRDDDAKRRKPMLVGELIVGYPTQCEPLWGPDPIFVDRAASIGARQLTEDEEVLGCQQALFSFRRLMLSAAGTPTTAAAAVQDEPVDVDVDGVRVVWVSREGDWARYVTNERDVLTAIDEHIAKNHASLANGKALSTGSSKNNKAPYRHLDVVKVRGEFEEQVRMVRERHTIYVTNHGANIIPSLYMRPNSGLITLDVSHVGFLPFALAPSWLHWRRMLIDRVCNGRMAKGKCKISSSNNDDNVVTADQLKVLLRAIDEVVRDQRARPKRAPKS